MSIIKRRQEFFKGLIQKTKNKTNLFDKISYKTKKPWIGARRIGKPGMGLQYYIYEDRGYVKLSIYLDKMKNKEIFDTLYKQKSDIKREIGVVLEWNRKDEDRESTIRKEFNEGGLDYPDTWSVLQEKMTDTMVKFEKAFRPRLQSIV